MKKLPLLLAFWANTSVAAEAAGGVPSAGHVTLQALLGLGLVVALILALAWFAKRLNLGAMHGQKHLATLAVLSLGAREKAVLVDVGGTQMLLGVSPGQVSTLHVFDSPVVEVPQSRSRSDVSPVAPGGDFATKLSEMLRQSVKSQ